MRAVLEEVVGPDMVGTLRPETEAGSVSQPEAPSLLLFLRYLQPLAPPDALDPLAINLPASLVQQRSDGAISVAANWCASSIISAVSCALSGVSAVATK